ncbi:hypothetical protein QVD99_008146 [Batrachochytrium dendrobatidis]|nr:hypothetical protein QVD99_008146 [Batrachochytrium dendrobatidis]
MKFSILFVLSAVATANAVLISAGSDRSIHASSTSSQVSGPTNEPNPSTSGQDWQVMSIINSNTPEEDQQQPIDQPSPNTASQDQQQTMIVAGPSTFKQSRKRPIDQPSPNTSEEELQDPTYQPGPSAPKRGRKRPIDKGEPANTSSNQETVLNEQDQETVLNEQDQETVLNEQDQETLDYIKETLKEILKKKEQAHFNYAIFKAKQKLALAESKNMPKPEYTPEAEKDLKQKYTVIRKQAEHMRRRLKKFMAKHGLKFEEPNLD